MGGEKAAHTCGEHAGRILAGQARWGYAAPIMDTLDFWTPDDALAFRCSVAEVGTLKSADAAAEHAADGLRADVREARLYAPRAMRALVRIMEGERAAPALQAACEILRRAYGDPEQPAPLPKPAAPAPHPYEPHPDWLDRQRLAYRAGEYDSPDSQLSAGQCLPRQ